MLLVNMAGGLTWASCEANSDIMNSACARRVRLHILTKSKKGALRRKTSPEKECSTLLLARPGHLSEAPASYLLRLQRNNHHRHQRVQCT